MDKKKTCKIISAVCLGLALLLLLLFAFFLGMDCGSYNPMHTSAPFYVCILVRGLEFLLPSGIAFLVACLLWKKAK